MDFKTTPRGSDIVSLLPTSDAFFKCMAIATTSESADYLCEQSTAKMQKSGVLKEAAEVLKKFDEFRQNVKLRHETTSDPWSGKIAPITDASTDFQNFHQTLAEDAAQSLADKVTTAITLDFAISDVAQLLRGYSLDGNAVDAKQLESFDKLFNAWLAKNKVISKGGVLYESTENGEIRSDEAGDPVRAQAERIKQLLHDKKEGLQQFLRDKNIQLTIQEHNYPKEAAVTEKGMEASTEMPETPSASATAS